jgi:hypothetical protein
MIESIGNIQNLQEYGGRFAKQKGGGEAAPSQVG